MHLRASPACACFDMNQIDCPVYRPTQRSIILDTCPKSSQRSTASLSLGELPMMKTVTALGLLVLLSAPVAMAKPWSIGICTADIKAKCADVKPGAGRIKDC